MRNDISFFVTKLTVLALVAVLAGCGGDEGGGSDQNQSSTQKPDNSEGGQAAKPMEKPAEKFTPEMVKAAAEMLEPESKNKSAVQPAQWRAMADMLNEHISDGKIDFKGLKVDEITVEALAKGLEANLKATIERVLDPELIPAEKPAEKFTPEMVKAAMEAALQQLPEMQTKKELAEIRAKMMDPAEIKIVVDSLNQQIVDGKIDTPDIKIDKITVEALTKEMVAKLPGAQRRANVLKSKYKAAKLADDLLDALIDSPAELFPAADKWCDAILQYVGPLSYFYSPQHPDTRKLLKALPEGKRMSHYAMNKAMAGKDHKDPDVVLVFECDLGWNGAGGLEDALKYMDKLKLEKISVAKVGGSAHSVTKEELKKLKWVPGE